MKTVAITTRFYGSAFYARGGGKTCSSTSSERSAVEGLLKKLGSGGCDSITQRKACQLVDGLGWVNGRWAADLPADGGQMAGEQYLALCVKVGAGKAFGALVDYEAGTLTIWPHMFGGQGLCVTFKMPAVGTR